MKIIQIFSLQLQSFFYNYSSTFGRVVLLFVLKLLHQQFLNLKICFTLYIYLWRKMNFVNVANREKIDVTMKRCLNFYTSEGCNEYAKLATVREPCPNNASFYDCKKHLINAANSHYCQTYSIGDGYIEWRPYVYCFQHSCN